MGIPYNLAQMDPKGTPTPNLSENEGPFCAQTNGQTNGQTHNFLADPEPLGTFSIIFWNILFGVGFLFGQNIFWSEFCGDSIPSGFEYDWCELWIW